MVTSATTSPLNKRETRFLCLIGNFIVRTGGKYVEALDLCAEKC